MAGLDYVRYVIEYVSPRHKQKHGSGFNYMTAAGTKEAKGQRDNDTSQIGQPASVVLKNKAP